MNIRLQCICSAYNQRWCLYQRQISFSMKFRDLEYSTQVILKVIYAVLGLAFLWAIRDIIVLLLLALLLASAMEPLVYYLKKHKIPRAVSVVAVYVLVLGLAVLIIYLLVPPVVSQFKILQQHLPSYSSTLQTRYAWLFGGGSVNAWFQQLIAGISNGQNFLSSTFGAFNGVLNFIAVLVIAFYLVAEQRGMQTFISSFLPSDNREFTVQLVNKIQTKMGMWVLGQIIVSLGIFIFTYIGLLVLHVQFALVLALIAGFMEIVPYIGPFVSAIPAMFIAFIQHPPLVIAVVILYILVHELEGYVLVPKIMEKTIGTSPLAVLVALLVGYQLAGIVGLLLSVPLVAARP